MQELVSQQKARRKGERLTAGMPIQPGTFAAGLQDARGAAQVTQLALKLNAARAQAEPRLGDRARASDRSAGTIQLRLVPNPAGPQHNYIHIPDDQSPPMHANYTHFGHNRFQANDGSWWAYLANQDRFQPIRAPHHPEDPQAFAPIARGGFSMRNRADEATPWNSLLAVGEQEYNREFGSGMYASDPFEQRDVEFSAQFGNPAARKDLGRVAAKHFGQSGRLSANELAGQSFPSMQNDGIDREYLHQQSHGGGGRDAMGNLGVGSAAANTEMIPIEAAINGRSDLRLGVTFAFHPATQILAMVEMRIIRSADGAVLDRRRIDAQQRYFTREQYDQLRRWTGYVVDPGTLAELTNLNIADPRILAWIQFLTGFSSQGGSGSGNFGGGPPDKGGGGGFGGGGSGFGGGSGPGNNGPSPMVISV